jgi:fructokinase
MTPKIIVYGEMLWDMLPSGKQPGGAPMNVAIHLKNFGLEPLLISRVGSDDLGTELLDYLENKGLERNHIQTGTTHLTGIVKVNLADRNEVTYKIVQPVAWDYIQLTTEIKTLVQQADLLVYGSLAARSSKSRETLIQMLEVAKLKVFDVNLRPPHFDQPTVEHLLAHAGIAKLNEHELSLIAGWYGLESELEDQIKFLAERFSLQMVCVTLGAEGAVVYTQNTFYWQKGYSVAVEDTIGSGDAFLAMFLKGYLTGTSIPETLRRACAMGALVATYRGATPGISESELMNFITVNQP